MMIHKIYATLLQLYPRQFRQDFGNEMVVVFKQATSAGKIYTLRFLFRELWDFPINLVHQHWAAIQKEELPLNVFSQTEEPQPGTWRETFLAGIPHLLMGCLFGIGKFFDQTLQINQTFNLVLGVSLSVLVVALLIFAWRRSWPLWSASWYFYGSWVTIMVLGLGIEQLNLEESWRYTNIMFLGWIALCVIGYFIILAKSNLHGLLSVAVLFPMLSLTLLEFIPNPIEGMLAIFVGLLSALTAGIIVRKGEFRIALTLVLGLNLVVGLAWTYVSEYKVQELPNGITPIPEFSNFLKILGFYVIFGLGILALPFILRGIWNFGKRKFST